MKLDLFATVVMVAGVVIALGVGLLGTMFGIIDADTGRQLAFIGAGIAFIGGSMMISHKIFSRLRLK